MLCMWETIGRGIYHRGGGGWVRGDLRYFFEYACSVVEEVAL